MSIIPHYDIKATLVPDFTKDVIALSEHANYNWSPINKSEGSHSGLVRPPAKRLGDESPLMGSNPIPSASSFP